MSQVQCERCGKTHPGEMLCNDCLHDLELQWMSNHNDNINAVGTISDRNKPITDDSVKTLGNTCASGATKNVKDIVFWGNGDTFKLISKASSEREGWMKSTKAMQAGTAVVIQVTTQQKNPDGSYSLAEALTTVNEAYIDDIKEDDNVVSRVIVSMEADKVFGK